jgi:hypothetical protein
MRAYRTHRRQATSVAFSLSAVLDHTRRASIADQVTDAPNADRLWEQLLGCIRADRPDASEAVVACQAAFELGRQYGRRWTSARQKGGA